MPGRIGIICAMTQEIQPLVRSWQKVRERGVTFFESEKAIAVAAGIGSAPAALATMTLVAREQPSCLMSAGIAGALQRDLKVGDVLWARAVINVATGKRFVTAQGKHTIVSGRVIASAERKRELREEFGADAIDMEGAGVASIAESCGLPFYAVKAISDEVDFAMPPMNDFVDATGKFRMAAFLAQAVLHPAWWRPTAQLALSSRKASLALCREIEHQIEQFTNSQQGALEPHQ